MVSSHRCLCLQMRKPGRSSALLAVWFPHEFLRAAVTRSTERPLVSTKGGFQANTWEVSLVVIAPASDSEQNSPPPPRPSLPWQPHSALLCQAPFPGPLLPRVCLAPFLDMTEPAEDSQRALRSPGNMSFSAINNVSISHPQRTHPMI